MGYTKCTLDELSIKENELMKIFSRTDNIMDEFVVIQNSIDKDISQRENIHNQLNEIQYDMRSIVDNTYNASKVINDAVTQYSNCERELKNILNGLLDVKNEVQSTSITDTYLSSNDSDNFGYMWIGGLFRKVESKITHLQKFLSKTNCRIKNAKLLSIENDNTIDKYNISEDFGNGFITINNMRIPIYIPNDKYITDSDDGWKDTGLTRTITNLDFDFINTFGHLGSSLEEDRGIPYKEVTRKQLINYKNFVCKGGKVQKGLIAIEIATAALDNLTRNVLSINIQEKDKQKRAIIQIGSYNNNTLMNRAGTSYSKLAFGYMGEPGHDLAVKGLNDYLTTFGYEDYIKGEKHTNLRLTVDSKHYNDPFVGYIGVNDNQELTITPKLYKDDNIQIIREKTILYQYYYGGYEVIYDLYDDIREAEPSVINSSIIKKAMKKYQFSN